MTGDRRFSCTTWSVDENLCLTKSSVVLLPPSVKSMSFQKLGYTTSSIDENQRAGQKLGCTTSSVVVSRGPTKNSLVLLLPSEKIDVRRKTWLYYLSSDRRNSMSERILGCTTFFFSLPPPFPSGKNYRPTKITVILLSPFLKIVRPTVNPVLLLVPFSTNVLRHGRITSRHYRSLFS